jgi:hypothetical protein
MRTKHKQMMERIKMLIHPPDPNIPDIAVFRATTRYQEVTGDVISALGTPTPPDSHYQYQGRILTRQECMQVPVNKMRIFVKRVVHRVLK